MSNINPALDILEGSSKRLLWLPIVTLAYIYTLSGHWMHLLLAILSIGGARFIFDLFDSLEDRKEKGELDDHFLDLIVNHYSTNTNLLTKLLVVIYPVAVISSIRSLFLRYFTHQNPILVGLAVIYGGVVVIVIMNLTTNISEERSDILPSEPVNDDQPHGEQPDISGEED